VSIERKPKPGPINIRFKEMLGALKEKWGHSRVRIAKNLAVERAALTHLVSGRTKAPSGQTVRLLGDVYGVSAGWLHDGAGEMLPISGPKVNAYGPGVESHGAGTLSRPPSFPSMTHLEMLQKIEGVESGLKVNSQLLTSVQEMVSMLREVNKSQIRSAFSRRKLS